MWVLLVAMIVILVLALLVAVYVAYPHRGEDVPYAGWLGRALRKGAETAPTLDNTAQAPQEPAEPSLAFDLSRLGHGGPEDARG